MKRAIHLLAIILALGYIGLSLIPTSALWFDPSTPVFADAEEGTAPAMLYERTIHDEMIIAYVVVARPVGNGTEVFCEGDNGAGFPYKPGSGPIVGKDLVWWASGDERCRDLAAGSYEVTTTWTINQPMRSLLPAFLQETILSSLLPPRIVVRTSPVFQITAR